MELYAWESIPVRLAQSLLSAEEIKPVWSEKHTDLYKVKDEVGILFISGIPNKFEIAILFAATDIIDVAKDFAKELKSELESEFSINYLTENILFRLYKKYNGW